MHKIRIADLEVFYRVGITDEERSTPQHLLLTVEFDYDFTVAAREDRIDLTVDYFTVSQELLQYGDKRDWKLIETLAVNLADTLLSKYKAIGVTIEVKKFVVPEAAYVSVVWSKKAM